MEAAHRRDRGLRAMVSAGAPGASNLSNSIARSMADFVTAALHSFTAIVKPLQHWVFRFRHLVRGE